MTKKFKRGLVVGKFAPLHKGHELVIRRAHELCDEVFIISYSKPEFPGCGPAAREHWLAQLFPHAKRLVVTDAIAPLPPNDAEDQAHRRFVGGICQKRLNLTVDAVFTSENYGDGFATELTKMFREQDVTATAVTHVQVDLSRATIPISGTAIRADVHRHRSWLTPVVYASFVERVCFLGGESTGKSTLTKELAREFQTEAVAEYGRELWDAKSGALAFDDFRRIAEEQVRREESAAKVANRFIFCDTSPLTTLFYSQVLFGAVNSVVKQLATRRYHHVFLCAPDFSFVQDGTRQDEAFRQRQHAWYVAELKRRQVPFGIISGPMQNRVRQIAATLTSRVSTQA